MCAPLWDLRLPGRRRRSPRPVRVVTRGVREPSRTCSFFRFSPGFRSVPCAVPLGCGVCIRSRPFPCFRNLSLHHSTLNRKCIFPDSAKNLSDSHSGFCEARRTARIASQPKAAGKPSPAGHRLGGRSFSGGWTTRDYRSAKAESIVPGVTRGLDEHRNRNQHHSRDGDGHNGGTGGAQRAGDRGIVRHLARSDHAVLVGARLLVGGAGGRRLDGDGRDLAGLRTGDLHGAVLGERVLLVGGGGQAQGAGDGVEVIGLISQADDALGAGAGSGDAQLGAGVLHVAAVVAAFGVGGGFLGGAVGDDLLLPSADLSTVDSA